MSQGSDPGRVSVSLLQHVAPSLRLRLSSAIGKGQCPDRVLPVVWAVGVPAVLWSFRVCLSLSTEKAAAILKGGLRSLPTSPSYVRWCTDLDAFHSFTSLASFKKGFVLVT